VDIVEAEMGSVRVLGYGRELEEAGRRA